MSMKYTAAINSPHSKNIDVHSTEKRSNSLIPLSMVNPGQEVLVKSIRGKDDAKRFLENLGFVENTTISIVNELGGNVIVNVKGTRVAISKAMASRIITA